MLHRFLFILVLFIQPVMGRATGQDANIICYQGEKWAFLACPLQLDPKRYEQIKDALPKERSIDSGNWRGYISHWSVVHDMLVLDSITYRDMKKRCSVSIKKAKLHSIFKRYLHHGKVVATWATGTFRLGKGACVRYEHMGFDRNYETETFLRVDNGRVTPVSIWHNGICPGLEINDILAPDSIENHIPLALLPELQGRHVVFKVRMRPSQMAQMADSCKVMVVRCSPDTLTDTERTHVETVVAQALRSVYPWKMNRINGDRSFPQHNFYFRLKGNRPTRGRIYEVCDTMPVFPGGHREFVRFMMENMRWPAAAQECCGQWRVLIRFVVETDGSLSSPILLRQADAPFEEEALRLFHLMPRYIPGKHQGKPVRCMITVPIDFRLT